MRVGCLSVLLACFACASALLIPHLGESAAFTLVVPAMLVCLVFAWLMVFESNGVRRSRKLSEFLVYGLLVPVFINWNKPVSLSFNGMVCLASAAIALGAISRMLWASYA